MQRNIFRALPILGAIRSRTGKLIDATDQLLASAGLTRRQAIGKHVTAVFGAHVRVWLAADREALRDRRASERLEYSARSGRWWRSHRVPQSGVVLWVGAEATAEVRLAALKAVLTGTDKSSALRDCAQSAAPWVLAGDSEADIRNAFGWSKERSAAVMIQLLR